MTHDPYIPAQPRRIDYDRIANTGDTEMYRIAWEENPDERSTLEDIFPDLHEDVFGEDDGNDGELEGGEPLMTAGVDSG